MTKKLKKAFDEASKLPETEQDAIGHWLLREIESERRWSDAFAGSADTLAELADEAIREHADGRTEELQPDKL